MKIEPPSAPHHLDTETINSLIEHQLREWPLSRRNFDRLRETKRKPAPLGELQSAVQLNPARIVSTGAKTDAASIAQRPCFLCADNRPEEQLQAPWPNDNWDFLINPYPILPVHFTIASSTHIPQDKIPLDMATMAEAAPSLVFFFNGAHAGASAPDHLHAQAVLKCELPLLKIAEKHHSVAADNFMSSEDFGAPLPFHFISAVITPDAEGMKALSKISGSFGIDADTGLVDTGLVNAFFWIDDRGMLRIIIVPRRKHRPECYGTGEGQLLISPGAIDMAGIIITPREEDFERADADTIRKIYADVAFADRLPAQIKNHFGI